MIKALVISSCLVAAFAYPQYNQQQNHNNQQQYQPQQQQYQQQQKQYQPQQQQQYQPQQQQQQQQYQPQQQQQQQQYQPQQNQRQQNPPVVILSQSNNVQHDGTYSYSFEGGDGTRAEQNGNLKTIGKEAGEVSQGSYSYVGDDGKTYSVSYIADEGGFRAVGDHLPKAPPIPEEIQKSLAFLATAPPPKDEPNYN